MIQFQAFSELEQLIWYNTAQNINISKQKAPASNWIQQFFAGRLELNHSLCAAANCSAPSQLRRSIKEMKFPSHFQETKPLFHS